MSVPSRTSLLRTTLGRTAVAGAAALVSVMGVAPAALADDGDLAPETQEADPPAGQDEQPDADVQPTDEQDGDTPQTDEESATDGQEVPRVAALPIAQNDSIVATSGDSVLFDPLENDGVDPADVTGVTITQPQHGSAAVPKTDGSADWRIRYTPTDDYTGPDSFTYTVTTAAGTSAPAVVTVDVQEEGEEVEPVFGNQKFLVGVQIKDGSYVEDDATTVGSTFTIRTTLDGETTTQTCTTQLGTGTLSICNDAFAAPAGATVRITQDTAGPGLVRSTETRTLEPCTLDPEDGPEGTCGPEVVFFENTGPLPEPVDDRATTDQDTAVSIDVLENDTSNDPATELTLASEPDDGTAEITGEGVEPTPPVETPGIPGGPAVLAVPAGGSQQVLYTPDPGFTGTDRFTYTLTNSNGASTAQVVVRVVDGTVADSDAGTGTTGDGSAALPDTGGADIRLLGVGGLLAATGVALVRGRRRTSDVLG